MSAVINTPITTNLNTGSTNVNYNSVTKSLNIAIKNNSFEKVKKDLIICTLLLDDDFHNSGEFDSYLNKALVYSSSKNYTEIVKFLLKYGTYNVFILTCSIATQKSNTTPSEISKLLNDELEKFDNNALEEYMKENNIDNMSNDLDKYMENMENMNVEDETSSFSKEGSIMKYQSWCGTCNPNASVSGTTNII